MHLGMRARKNRSSGQTKTNLKIEGIKSVEVFTRREESGRALIGVKGGEACCSCEALGGRGSRSAVTEKCGKGERRWPSKNIQPFLSAQPGNHKRSAHEGGRGTF